MVVRRTLKNEAVVAGGGAIEVTRLSTPLIGLLLN
jgi:chaperonin GroEL (HSP60 family)